MIAKPLLTAAVAALALSLSAPMLAQGPPSQLGISDQDGRDDLMTSLTSGGPAFGRVTKAFLALPGAARGAVVQASFAWMKLTVNSTAFKNAYAQQRDSIKPTPPQVNGTVDAELKRKQDEMAQQLQESRKMLAMVPAAQRAELETVMRNSETQMKSPEMVAAMRQGIIGDRAAAQESYQHDLKSWQENWPANPLALVARRIQKFLELSADIDFSAKTVMRDGKLKFVESVNEEKSGEWKMLFRAGREAVTAARTAAAAWLKELPAA